MNKKNISLNIISFVFFSMSIILFLIGFHNMDLAYNYAHYPYQIVDTDLFGNIRNMNQAYIEGLYMCFFGLSFEILAFLIQYFKNEN